MSKFSIILPTYNRINMLPRAIKSVICQTYLDYELIIVDDGCNFDIEEVISSFHSSRVKIVHHEKNLGAAEARNSGLRSASGELIAFLDDDDEYMPRFLESSLAVLSKSNYYASFCWCSAIHAEYSDRNSGNYVLRKRILKKHYTDRVNLFEEFLSIGIGSGVVINSECLQNIGYFNTNLKVAEDSELFLRLLDYGYSPIPNPEIGIKLHDHKLERLTDKTNNLVRIDECRWLISKYYRFFSRYPRILAQFQGHVKYLQDQLSNKSGESAFN